MNSAKKTTFFACSALVVSVSIFLFVMSIVPDYVYLEHKEFYSQDLPGEKIFIFGTSHVYALNPMIITDELIEKGYNYTVYNLGQGSFDAEERLRTIDFVISQEPKVVVYGIAYQTFYSHGRNIAENPPESFPSPTKLVDLLSTVQIPLNTGLLDNPKFATINTVNHFYQRQTGEFQEEPERPYPNTPFFVYTPYSEIPAEQKDLENDGKFVNYKGHEIYPINKNRTYEALKELIRSLHEHDIEVIIFTTPHLKNWLEQVPAQQDRKSVV